MAESSKERFTLFYHRDSPFSQHHYSEFTIDDVTYNCAEQYMMHQKAMVFKDYASAKLILESTSPHKQKALGRQVKNFDNVEWDKVCEDIVKRANIAKFSQNADLKAALFKTAGTTLVEASPTDNKWGIGLSEEDPLAQDRKTWKGKNLLGQILTIVRDELMSKSLFVLHQQAPEIGHAY